jgi:hypothetical protein
MPKTITQAIFDSIYQLDLNAFRLLLSIKGSDVNVKDRYGQTPLHAAVEQQHPDMIKDLLDQGADIDAKDCYGLTPLVTSVAPWKSPQITKYLLERGACPHGFETEEPNAIHYLASQCEMAITRWCYLLKLFLDHGVHINGVDDTGKTPLHWACYLSAGEETIDNLMESGADPFWVDDDGKLPIEYLDDGNIKDTLEIYMTVDMHCQLLALRNLVDNNDYLGLVQQVSNTKFNSAMKNYMIYYIGRRGSYSQYDDMVALFQNRDDDFTWGNNVIEWDDPEDEQSESEDTSSQTSETETDYGTEEESEFSETILLEKEYLANDKVRLIINIDVNETKLEDILDLISEMV